jgi:hypothetical protein
VAGGHDFLILHPPVTEFSTVVISEKYVDTVLLMLESLLPVLMPICQSIK